MNTMSTSTPTATADALQAAPAHPVATRRQWLRAAAGGSLVTALAAVAQTVAADSGSSGLPEGVKRLLGAPVKPRGTARLRMLGLNIYDAKLWTVDPFAPERYQASPLALELVYARALKGARIAETSLDEMRRGGPIPDAQAQQWLAFMRQAFPDVKAGHQIVGVWDPREARSSFFVNGAPGEQLQDAAFGERFFGIWLAPHSSQPELRLRLLGLAPS
jgi:Chalcone isomerase-like